jgi:lipoprotein-anchoring transpeptidase ErfK/SrfK
MRALSLSALILAAALAASPASAAIDASGPLDAPAPPPESAAIPLPPERPADLVPRVVARVDIARQTMTVEVDGEVVHTWRVSTARPGKVTPKGTFRPQVLSPRHRSSLYDGAPMPYAVFFNGHIAVHGTTEVRRLGRPASAGCVRLDTAHARTFFDLVRRTGMSRVQIVVA